MSMRSNPVLSLLFLFASTPVAAGEQLSAEMLTFNCFTCHSAGVAGNREVQSLHDFTAAEIRNRLQAFKRGEGDPTIMDRIAKGYTDEEIELIARYLAKEE